MREQIGISHRVLTKLRTWLASIDEVAKDHPVAVFFLPMFTTFLLFQVFAILAPFLPSFLASAIFLLFISPACLISLLLAIRASKHLGPWR
jgi:hypothetical protein